MQEGALIPGGCMWSLMDLYALRFLSTGYRLCYSSSGSSIWSVFKFSPESGSCGKLTLTSLPFEFLTHSNMHPYWKNRATTKRDK